MAIEFPPDGAETGWARCTRCQELAYQNDGPGQCGGASPHDFTGTSAYSVAVKAPSAPPPVTVGAHVVITESAQSVVIEGVDFSPSTAISISFIHGAMTKTASVTSDHQGHFTYTDAVVVEDDAGGSLIAKEATGRLVTGHLEKFIPATDPAHGQ